MSEHAPSRAGACIGQSGGGPHRVHHVRGLLQSLQVGERWGCAEAGIVRRGDDPPFGRHLLDPAAGEAQGVRRAAGGATVAQPHGRVRPGDDAALALRGLRRDPHGATGYPFGLRVRIEGHVEDAGRLRRLDVPVRRRLRSDDVPLIPGDLRRRCVEGLQRRLLPVGLPATEPVETGHEQSRKERQGNHRDEDDLQDPHPSVVSNPGSGWPRDHHRRSLWVTTGCEVTR